jgi:broad specificity phosphatase PhoE
MKKIVVRKIFSYDPTFAGKYSKYVGYALIAKKKLDPSIEDGEAFKKNFDTVFCSSLKRGIQSAKRYSNTKIEKLSLLDEISFDLTQLLSKEEYKRFGSNLVRQRFVEAFVTDNLDESRKSLKSRIKILIKKLEELPEGDYLLVSHSFFMKIVEVFLKEDSLFDNPDLVRKHFNTDNKTYEFGSGFEFKLI